LVAAQERLLTYAAEVWNVRSIPFTDVLDVGCGLGGGAIFWAQEFGASVTAVTIVRSHLSWVAKFAAQAGVRSLIRPLLRDASEIPGENCFDAAVAIESCSSFPREAWFERIWALLRVGGRVLIADLFLGKPEYQDPVDCHWLTQIGTIDEYLTAARRAGFHGGVVHDYSEKAERFWATTCELLRVEAQNPGLTLFERAKLLESLRIHSMMRQGVVDGGLRYALVSIAKKQEEGDLFRRGQPDLNLRMGEQLRLPTGSEPAVGQSSVQPIRRQLVISLKGSSYSVFCLKPPSICSRNCCCG